MKGLSLFAVVVCLALVARPAVAQVSITGTGTYTQTFDSLLATESATWADNSTLANWYAQRSVTGSFSIAASAGTNTGGLYSFGTGTATDRALGSVGSGTTGDFAYGVAFRNNSGSPITLGTLSYVGEQWRNSAAPAQTLTVWYQISGSNITSFGAGNNTGWTQLTSLTFTGPITGGSAGALDGNSLANRVSISDSLSSITLTSGQFLAIRFSDIDHPGNDHSLSIDNFSLSYAAIPEPTTYAAIFGGLALAGAILHRRRKQRQSVAA